MWKLEKSFIQFYHIFVLKAIENELLKLYHCREKSL